MESEKLYGIADIKQAIQGKTKKEKLLHLRQERNNFLLSQNQTSGSSLYETDFAKQVDDLFVTLENDKSHKEDCDWNWFFNADNIPNQDLVFATKDFLESKRKVSGDSLEMMNILWRQMEEIKENLIKPVDFVERLKTLPLDETKRHTLFGLLLKWHGGYPVKNLDPKYNTLLKLIEREFLAMFLDELTPEKEFCAVDISMQKKLNEATAHINAELRRKFGFTESRYLNKVTINFEDLPDYIVQRGMVWRFEEMRMPKDSDYLDWERKYAEFLQTIPDIYMIKALSKGIEFGRKAYQYHRANECTDPEACVLNQSWERRIAIAERMLQKITPTQPANERLKPVQDYDNCGLPILELTAHERLWLQEIYERVKRGSKFTFKEVYTKLFDSMPENFQPNTMNSHLISSTGEEIRILGVVALERNYSIVKIVDESIHAIKAILLNEPEKETILLSEITAISMLSLEETSLALVLARDYGTFFRGWSQDNNNRIIKSITVSGDEGVFYAYMHYPGIVKILLKKLNEPRQEDQFTWKERKTMDERIDQILVDLQNLKFGQEILYTDILKELEELKTLYNLGKKNWRQLMAGKFAEMFAGGVVSETLSKRIAECINPVIDKLVG